MNLKAIVNKTLEWMDDHQQELLWGAYLATSVACFTTGYKHGKSKKEIGRFWTWALGPTYKLGKYLGR